MSCFGEKLLTRRQMHYLGEVSVDSVVSFEVLHAIQVIHLNNIRISDATFNASSSLFRFNR